MRSLAGRAVKVARYGPLSFSASSRRDLSPPWGRVGGFSRDGEAIDHSNPRTAARSSVMCTARTSVPEVMFVSVYCGDGRPAAEYASATARRLSET